MLYLSMWEKNISKTKLMKSVFQTPHDFKNDYSYYSYDYSYYFS